MLFNQVCNIVIYYQIYKLTIVNFAKYEANLRMIKSNIHLTYITDDHKKRIFIQHVLYYLNQLV